MTDMTPKLPLKQTSADEHFCHTHHHYETQTRYGIRFKRLATLVMFTAIAAGIMLGASYAQQLTLGLNNDTGLTQRLVQLIALITVLSVAPSILIMVTSFTRIVVVLSLLRTAIGAGTAPPNMVMISLAMFLTSFIMWPTLSDSYNNGVAPYLAGQIQEQQAFERSTKPLHEFMRKNVREKDVQLFQTLAKTPAPETQEALSFRVLIPAFMISELRRAFEIGFLLFLPFLVIDLVVASVLTSMGMMMLPPVTIALPFKLIFFVLVDGWVLIAGSLVQSFVQ